MNPFDHLYALLIFVAFPIYAALTFPAEVELIRAAGEPARIKAYRQVIVTWLLFAFVLIALWVVAGREFASLGLQWPPLDKALIATVAGLLIGAVFVLPLRAAAEQGNSDSVVPDHMRPMLVLLPSTRREERWFQGVSWNAGVTEELIFRGYLLWYLQHFVNVYWAAVIATAAFGLAHLYQGARNLPGLLLVSAVTVGLYLYTDSLLVPVIFHIALDVAQGRYIARIKQQLERETDSSEPAPT